MNEQTIEDLARNAGATDEQGGRASGVFCFARHELKGFADSLIKATYKPDMNEKTKYEMQYMIVKEYKQNVFEVKVQDLIDNGWKLQGGVSIAVNGTYNETYFAQALVKEK